MKKRIFSLCNLVAFAAVFVAAVTPVINITQKPVRSLKCFALFAARFTVHESMTMK